ncbi:MAG: hypothetical protein ACK5L3_02855 [Oscillospiraceae bacterium]
MLGAGAWFLWRIYRRVWRVSVFISFIFFAPLAIFAPLNWQWPARLSPASIFCIFRIGPPAGFYPNAETVCHRAAFSFFMLKQAKKLPPYPTGAAFYWFAFVLRGGFQHAFKKALFF